LRLQGKVCFITGAGSGIGRASAQLFAEEGAAVAVADIDDAGAAETVAAIGAAGGSVRAFHMDVTSLESCDAATAQVVGAYGAIDVLFNNAGIAGVGKLHLTPVELWDRVMAVNVRGVYLRAGRSCPT